MYKKVKLLNKENDKNIKVKPFTDYSFAKNTSKAVITVDEIFKASCSYPIMLLKNEDGYSAVALMGVKEDKNLFMNGNEFNKGLYIPASIRRYPFIFVKHDNNLSLAYDEDSKEINKKIGEKLFETDGSNTKKLDEILEFMKSFQNSYAKTENFIKQLDEKNLLEDVNINLKNGQKRV